MARFAIRYSLFATSDRRRCGHAPGAAQIEPDVRIVLRLALDEAVSGRVPGSDLIAQIVEHEFAAVGLDGQDRVAFSVEIAHDRHQQRLPREALLDEQLALVEGIDLAIALAVDRIITVVR